MSNDSITPFESGKSTRSLQLAGPHVWQDLKTLIGRMRRVDGAGAVHLSAPASQPVLATWVAVMDSSAGIVLGMRTFQLAHPGGVEATVYLAGIADRLAREMNLLTCELGIPPVAADPGWARQLPPISGWEPVGVLPSEQVAQAAREGAKQLAETAPQVPGLPMVNALRNQIWFSPLIPGVPQGAAFALDVLGFLPNTGHIEVYRNGNWYRLGTRRGYVLTKLSSSD